ncbi:hypothetical protein PV682_19360 [Streptomyces niveiscabiei]|uniref:hypothetical protein n=1 Tax=Streptomyces niveiscabiei TaxID=164115 RepID=UPI0029B094BC|nr:hypothetical protein [Streptomyces niveiscabiei]MDX3383605.1 hypothetical protein [Streptomyces niveiscabiei]
MATVRQETGAADVDDSIDVELLLEMTDLALKMELNTSTRAAIDTRTVEVGRHLNILLVQDLGADENPEVRELFRKGYRLLDLKQRPTSSTPAFAAFFHLREMAELTRCLLRVYAEGNGRGIS